MINKIYANIDKNHIWHCDTKTIGRQGENICTQLEITLEECLCDSWVYLHFEKADGITKVTPKLEIVDNKVIYDIGNDLLDIDGDLKVFVELHKESGLVWKSSTKAYTVLDSFNGVDQIENKEDFITEAQRLLNEVETGLTPTIGENENWFILDKDTGKTSRGPQGEKGEKGDAGSIKFIIVNELPTEGIEEDAMYLVPNTNPEDQNSYDEYIYTNGQWELLGNAKVEVDLTDYVKNTDYASTSKAGVIKTEGSFGALTDSAGRLYINPATNTEIDARTNKRKPIVPENLKYAVESIVGGHVTLSQTDYDTLVSTGTVTTEDGTTYTYDENTYYYIEEE